MPSTLCILLYVLPIIVSGSNLALTWRSTEDALFQDAGLSVKDPELSFNEPAPSSDETVSLFDPVTLNDDLTGLSADSSHLFDQVDSSGDLDLFSTEPSNESTLWDNESSISMGSEDDSIINSLPAEPYDDALEVADCSTSEDLPGFDKSRVRRLDDGKVCRPRPQPLTNPFTDVKKRPNTDSGRVGFGYRKYKNLLLNSPELASLAELFSQTEDRNKICYLLSRGVLPYGYCPSNDPLDRSIGSFIQIPPLGFHFTWELRNFRAGTLIQTPLRFSTEVDANIIAIFSERAALLVCWFFNGLCSLLLGP